MSLTSKDSLAFRIGQNFRNIRLEKKMTIEELAFELGVEYTQLSRIERGKINTSVYQLYNISKALQVDISEIFRGVDSVAP